MKVWILMVGYYSEAEIVGAFDDDHKAEAEKLAELIGGHVEKESIELNKIVVHEKPPEGRTYFSIEMGRSGKIFNVTKCVPLDCYEDFAVRESDYSLKKYSGESYYRKSHWRLTVGVFAESKEHAIEITDQIRLQLIAGTISSEGLLNVDGSLREKENE